MVAGTTNDLAVDGEYCLQSVDLRAAAARAMGALLGIVNSFRVEDEVKSEASRLNYCMPIQDEP